MHACVNRRDEENGTRVCPPRFLEYEKGDLLHTDSSLLSERRDTALELHILLSKHRPHRIW